MKYPWSAVILLLWGRPTADLSKVMRWDFSSSLAHISFKLGSEIDANFRKMLLKIRLNLFWSPCKTAKISGWQWMIEMSFENSVIVSSSNRIVGRTQPIDIVSSFCRISNAFVNGSIILTYSNRNSSSVLVKGNNVKVLEDFCELLIFLLSALLRTEWHRRTSST